MCAKPPNPASAPVTFLSFPQDTRGDFKNPARFTHRRLAVTAKFEASYELHLGQHLSVSNIAHALKNAGLKRRRFVPKGACAMLDVAADYERKAEQADALEINQSKNKSAFIA
jgi:hypothetical protein